MDKLDHIDWAIITLLIETEPGRLRQVAERTALFPQGSYAACATGETNVIISLRARNIEELFSFITENLGKITGVRNTQPISCY